MAAPISALRKRLGINMEEVIFENRAWLYPKSNGSISAEVEIWNYGNQPEVCSQVEIADGEEITIFDSDAIRRLSNFLNEVVEAINEAEKKLEGE